MFVRFYPLSTRVVNRHESANFGPIRFFPDTIRPTFNRVSSLALLDWLIPLATWLIFTSCLIILINEFWVLLRRLVLSWMKKLRRAELIVSSWINICFEEESWINSFMVTYKFIIQYTLLICRIKKYKIKCIKLYFQIKSFFHNLVNHY